MQECHEWSASVEPAAGADSGQPVGVTAQVYSFRNAWSPQAVRFASAGLQSLTGANIVRWKHDILVNPIPRLL